MFIIVCLHYLRIEARPGDLWLPAGRVQTGPLGTATLWRHWQVSWLIYHFAYRGSLHRRKRAATHVIEMVWLYRSPILVGRNRYRILPVQLISTCIRGACTALEGGGGCSQHPVFFTFSFQSCGCIFSGTSMSTVPHRFRTSYDEYKPELSCLSKITLQKVRLCVLKCKQCLTRE
jgi:hypothetical protein